MISCFHSLFQCFCLLFEGNVPSVRKGSYYFPILQIIFIKIWKCQIKPLPLQTLTNNYLKLMHYGKYKQEEKE